tara:strand:- start:637 stop:1032 length:396 start_codon:yes stop_codon:yes gene_type:complete
MKKEIERKFLVKCDLFEEFSIEKKYILQVYLNNDPNRTVRVRIISKVGFLSIEGRSNKKGTSRLEWEEFIPKSKAKSLLELAMDIPIEKIRCIIPYGFLTIEVDEFLSHKKGLVLAEIELPMENTPFKKPD